MRTEAVIDKLRDWWQRQSATAFKAAIGGLVVLAFAVPLALVALPFVEFFNDMAAQPKGKTQMSYGRVYGQEVVVERSAVQGSIPRDYVRYAYADKGNTIEEAKDVGLRLQNAMPVTMEHLLAGQKLYNVYCIVCHGKEGVGDGSIVGPERFPAPPSLHTDLARTYRDGTLFHIITKGVGKMPGYADKMEPDDRWKVVHYVRALQRSRDPKPEDLEP